MEILFVVVLTVIVALAFDLINGFHDSANSIATVVSTRVLSPRVAVLWAAFFNFAAMFIFAPRVANTIAKIISIDSADQAFVYVVLAGLVGAIVWDLITWYWGLPTSSSHALIGGLVGAGIAHSGLNIVHWKTVLVTVGCIPIAPLMGMVIGFFFMVAVFWIFRRKSPLAVDRFFRVGQLFSAALYSLGHGGNDAQKTMGTIVVLLVAAGYFKPDTQLSLLDWHTAWIILSCQTAMALGTLFGGWRIVHTMGSKITRLSPMQGFCAETGGAMTLFFFTHLGIPVSTTHTITGAIVGVGASRRVSAVRWGVAKDIVIAWIVTLPAAALTAALFYYIGFWMK